MKMRQLFKRTTSAIQMTLRPRRAEAPPPKPRPNGPAAQPRPEPADSREARLQAMLPAFYQAIARALDETKISPAALSFGGAEINARDVSVRLRLHQGEAAGKVIALAPAVEVQANWPFGVSLDRVGSTVFVRFGLPRKAQKALAVADLPAGAVGLTFDRQPVRVELDDSTRWALKIFGAPGAGKTTLAKLILLRLLQQHRPDQLRLAVCDPKGKFEVFRNAAHLGWDVATKPADIERVILAWCDEMDGRAGRRQAPGAFVLLIEEAAESLANPAVYGRLVKTARLCREYGGRIIYINQTNSGEDKHGELLNLMPYAITGKTASGYESARVSGQSGLAAQKLGHGGGAFKIEIEGQVTEFTAARVETADIVQAGLPVALNREKPQMAAVKPEPEAEPEPAQGRIVPSRVDVAIALEYRRVFGKPLSARAAAKLGVTRTRWQRLDGPVAEQMRLDRLRARARKGLEKLKAEGEL
ncbi:MAG: hypothetical protein FOGNACKC_02213 [Anaerolineae bacterium]|nr:hypothetical protein [Anaerolineae bacterium]